MKIVALFDRWSRNKLRAGEESRPAAANEDHSSMAEFVRLLTQLDLADGFRAPR